MILELHLSQAVKLITECGYPRNIREWPIKYIKTVSYDNLNTTYQFEVTEEELTRTLMLL